MKLFSNIICFQMIMVCEDWALKISRPKGVRMDPHASSFNYHLLFHFLVPSWQRCVHEATCVNLLGLLIFSPFGPFYGWFCLISFYLIWLLPIIVVLLWIFARAEHQRRDRMSERDWGWIWLVVRMAGRGVRRRACSVFNYCRANGWPTTWPRIVAGSRR